MVFNAPIKIKGDIMSQVETRVTAQVEEITPEYAAQLLELNDHNRKISNSNILTISGAIERGEWEVNGQPIIVDKEGRLMDGQHRLMAVQRTNKPILSVVVKGVEPEVFTTIDTGKVRKGGDTLSIACGLENPTTMANLIRKHQGYLECRMTSPRRLSNQQILNLYREREEMYDEAFHDGKQYKAEYHARAIFSLEEWMLIAIIKKDIKQGSEFVHSLLEGKFPNFEKRVNQIYKNGRSRTSTMQVWHGFFKTYYRWVKGEEETLFENQEWWDVAEAKYTPKAIRYPHLKKCKI